MTPVTMIPTLLYNFFFLLLITEVAFECPTWYYESNYIGGCVCGSELGESATSISIEFDEAVLNLVVLDSVQNESMIASRSFRIDFRTHGRSLTEASDFIWQSLLYSVHPLGYSCPNFSTRYPDVFFRA